MTPEEQQQQEQERYRYLQLKMKMSQQPADQVVDEAIPEIGFWDRLNVKNFAANDDEGFNYLQKEYPKLNFKKIDGEIVAKKPGDVAYKKFDPSKFEFSDITDVGSDVVAGIGSTAASAAGGLAGGAATLPTGGWGAIPGAMAAGGSASAALEAARQGIGRLTGVNREMDAGNIGFAGAAGTLSPLLFGTGASGKAVGQKVLQKLGEGASKEAVEAATTTLAKSQSGLPVRMLQGIKGSVAPWLGEKISGQSKEGIKRAAGMLDEVKAAGNDPSIITKYAQDTKEQITNNLTNDKKTLWQSVADNKEAVKKPVQNPVTTVLGELIAKYDKEIAENPGVPVLKEARDYIEKTIGHNIGELPNELTPQQAFSLKDRLNDLTKIRRSGDMPLSAIKAENDFMAASRKAVSMLDDNIKQTSPELKGALDKYRQLKMDEELVEKYFSSDQAVENTFKKLSARGKNVEKQNFLRLDKKYGGNLMENAQKTATLNTYATPHADIQSLGGTTSTTRSIPLAAAGSLAGYYAGNKVGDGYGGGLTGAAIGGLLGSKAGSAAALRQYMLMNRAASGVASKAVQAGNIGGASLPAVGLKTWERMYHNRSK